MSLLGASFSVTTPRGGIRWPTIAALSVIRPAMAARNMCHGVGTIPAFALSKPCPGTLWIVRKHEACRSDSTASRPQSPVGASAGMAWAWHGRTDDHRHSSGDDDHADAAVAAGRVLYLQHHPQSGGGDGGGLCAAAARLRRVPYNHPGFNPVAAGAEHRVDARHPA